MLFGRLYTLGSSSSIYPYIKIMCCSVLLYTFIFVWISFSNIVFSLRVVACGTFQISLCYIYTYFQGCKLWHFFLISFSICTQNFRVVACDTLQNLRQSVLGMINCIYFHYKYDKICSFLSICRQLAMTAFKLGIKGSIEYSFFFLKSVMTIYSTK